MWNNISKIIFSFKMVYYGLKVLANLANKLDFPIDQVRLYNAVRANMIFQIWFFKLNLIFCLCFGVCLGPLLRFAIRPCEQNTFKRHLFVVLVGLLMTAFCYGPQVIHLIVHALLSYGLLMFIPCKYVHL
jgi:hypothetical protein